MTKDRNFDFYGAQNGPKIGPLRPHISHTTESTCNEHVKQYWCETSDNLLRRWPKSSFFLLIWSPKWTQNGPFEAHIWHISESSSTEQIKKDWCESRGKCLTNWSKTCILTHLEAQNGPKIWASEAYLLHIYKSSSKFVNQVSCESSGN